MSDFRMITKDTTYAPSKDPLDPPNRYRVFCIFARGDKHYAAITDLFDGKTFVNVIKEGLGFNPITKVIEWNTPILEEIPDDNEFLDAAAYVQGLLSSKQPDPLDDLKPGLSRDIDMGALSLPLSTK